MWLHARTLAFRDVSHSKCAIETVQAFCIMVFWKRPTDNSAWIDLGVAIRMAMQLRLHEMADPTNASTPEDEAAHRVLAVSAASQTVIGVTMGWLMLHLVSLFHSVRDQNTERTWYRK